MRPIADIGLSGLPNRRACEGSLAKLDPASTKRAVTPYRQSGSAD